MAKNVFVMMAAMASAAVAAMRQQQIQFFQDTGFTNGWDGLNTRNGGRRNTVAQARRAATKRRNQLRHKRTA